MHKLIVSGKWNSVQKQLTTDNVNAQMAHGDTVAHMAALYNKKDILGRIYSLNPGALKISNDDGLTPAHLLAKYQYDGTLLYLLRKDPLLANVLDKENRTPLHFLPHNKPLMQWAVGQPGVELDRVDNDLFTIMGLNIKNGNQDIIDLLLPYVDLNIPSAVPPLHFSLYEDKPEIALMLIQELSHKSPQLLGSLDTSYMTPFLLSIMKQQHDVASELLSYGVDIDYAGPEGDHNPMVIAIKNNDHQMVDLLLDAGFNVNKQNRNMDTPLHMALKLSNASPTMIAKLLYHTDLSLKNINGQTPLHLLLQKYEWRHFNHFLAQKHMNLKERDNHGKTPLDMIPDKKQFLKDIVKNHKECKQLSIDECIIVIKKQMAKPSITGKLQSINNLTVNFGLFNSDTLHSMIYTLVILQKYPHMMIPNQEKLEDKVANNKLHNLCGDLYKHPHARVIADLVRIYSDYFFEVIPYLIIWQSQYRHYVHPEFGYHMSKLLNYKGIRFIIIKLTLVISVNSTHANIVIYDTKTKTVDRFEPYGNVPYMESHQLDDFLRQLFTDVLGHDIIYVSPQEMSTMGFQLISNDTQSTVKKLGDPIGYCLAWSCWYLEHRMRNPDVPPQKIIRKLLDRIGTEPQPTKFIDFIRNYAHGLDRQKNQFMEAAGVSKVNVYNLVLDIQDQQKLVTHMSKTLAKMINQRYK